jgi:hypothetical protein
MSPTDSFDEACTKGIANHARLGCLHVWRDGEVSCRPLFRVHTSDRHLEVAHLEAGNRPDVRAVE